MSCRPSNDASERSESRSKYARQNKMELRAPSGQVGEQNNVRELNMQRCKGKRKTLKWKTSDWPSQGGSVAGRHCTAVRAEYTPGACGAGWPAEDAGVRAR